MLHRRKCFFSAYLSETILTLTFSSPDKCVSIRTGTGSSAIYIRAYTDTRGCAPSVSSITFIYICNDQSLNARSVTKPYIQAKLMKINCYAKIKDKKECIHIYIRIPNLIKMWICEGELILPMEFVEIITHSAKTVIVSSRLTFA